jgi:H+-transporting ATPase
VEYSNFQMLLVKIVTILVIISCVLCLIVLIYLAIKTSFTEALSYAVVLMVYRIYCSCVENSLLYLLHTQVASIPMAIEIVTTTTLALGSKELVHDGAIVSRLAAIEDMAAMSILCSDKTGTLTMNKVCRVLFFMCVASVSVG